MSKRRPQDFAEAYTHCENLLDGNGRLTTRTRRRIQKLLGGYWDEPKARVIWHRAICLTGGARFESPGVIADAQGALGEELTTGIHLTMLFDGIMGLVRDSTMSGGNGEMATIALDRLGEALPLVDANGASWRARFTYAQARAMFELGNVTEAHTLHQRAASLWVNPDGIERFWADRNTLYRARTAQRLGYAGEVEAIGRSLFASNPALYGQYMPLICGGRKGQRHFDRMDIRW